MQAYVATPPHQLSATTVRSFAAPEADQGVAIDADHFYAVDNTVIAKYARDTGAWIDAWEGPRGGLIRHLNSCLVQRSELWCANSNYSLTPMGSSVEVFSRDTLRHIRSHSLGLMDEGSLTWFDRVSDGWVVGFAHYDGNGGAGFKDHRYASVITVDKHWRRTGGWLFPEAVVARMAPHAASGGAIGPDGLLYVLGHDRPELYVLAKPVMGPTLIHVATVAVEAEGQAFSWDHEERRIWAIDRRAGRVLEIQVPLVTMAAHPEARAFERR